MIEENGVLVPLIVDDEFVFLGGKFLAVASVEYAYQFADNFRAAVFVDAGSANDKFGSDLSKGVGVGLQWLSPIGDVQLFVARGKASVGSDNWRIHIIIGPGL
jgi:translocation and assembly module TamA